ncbi:TonB-dependent receptor plug domain-containing protein [uncultured Cyclobacterium sp.]|uniref:TonB-dependent receptor plug domain-containing protein n=1 Tax=uncultured Cyclobacterium sp. TaxID=453820 RepID=UPI0030EB2FAD
MRKVILIVITLLSVNFLVHSQTRTIRGTVTSFEDGLPIPGVTVQVKGAGNGTVTDIDGDYQLAIEGNGNVLVFRFVGMEFQEELVGNRSKIDVSLRPEVTSLEEVVVTSYGDQTRREVTGAIASVKGEIFQDLPMQSFDRAMQGRVAGVQVTSSSGQPGGTLTVQVRGVGSINAGTEPLYIVDGVQIASGALSGQGSQNALSSINPSDIESIEVFKDAAAAAIYGAQAANGVVLITTKKGKLGKTRVRSAH